MKTRLFTPLTLKGETLRNRLAVSPMCTYSARDGYTNDWHLVHLGSRAVGGAGMVIVEATAVVPEGRITPDDLGLWDDAHIEGLSRIAAFMRAEGAVPAIQLAHAGRKGSTASEWKGGGKFLTPAEGGWQTAAPSALPFAPGWGTPTALSEAAVGEVAGAFVAAARRAVEAGFGAVEIHAAHGYLLHEFLSPLTNRRTDGYGGSFEGRVRLTMEVVEGVRKVLPEGMPLLVRISATDWAEEGWDIDQSVRLAARLKQHGTDLLDVSSGGLLPNVQIPADYGYQVPFARRIKEETDLAVGTVGLITNAVQAETLLVNGDADLILAGREFLRDPYFPLHAAAQLGEPVQWPVQYRRAQR